MAAIACGRTAARFAQPRKDGAQVDPLVVGVVIVALVVPVVRRAVTLVPATRAGVVERLGRYRKTLSPGLSVVVPFVDRVRLVDMTERVISLSDVIVITRDDVAATVDGVVYAQVVDPKAATYEIANYQRGIEQLMTTTLRNWGGDLRFDEMVSDRDRLANQLRPDLEQTTTNWGVRINRVQIDRIGPPDGPDTADLLAMLGKLRAAGILTNDEFEAKRRQVLSPLPTETAGPDGD